MKKTLLLTLSLLLAAAPAQAQAQRDVKAELKKKTEIHEQLVKKSKEIGSEVKDLQSKLVKSSTTLRSTENMLNGTEKKLTELEKKHDKVIEDFYKEQEALGGLVSAAQRFRRTSTPQMLLQSKPIDAERTSIAMRAAIPALKAKTEHIRAQLAEIEKIQEQIGNQKTQKAKELKQINSQQDELEKLLKKREEVYKQTEADRRAQEQEVKKLAQEARNLDDLVLKIKAKKKAAPKTEVSKKLPAGMVLPVSGNVRTAFGETGELGDKSKGITFSTRPGASVITPLAGTVRFAGPFQKYRQILIVEHQGGYHSLIAGLGQIDTVVGASLSAGEPVGRAGSGDAAEIYYELRQNGDPVNPQKLLVAQRKQGKT